MRGSGQSPDRWKVATDFSSHNNSLLTIQRRYNTLWVTKTCAPVYFGETRHVWGNSPPRDFWRINQPTACQMLRDGCFSWVFFKLYSFSLKHWNLSKEERLCGDGGTRSHQRRTALQAVDDSAVRTKKLARCTRRNNNQQCVLS